MKTIKLAITLIIISTLMYSCSENKKENPEEEIIEVKTTKIKKERLIIPLRSVGKVGTENEIMLAFKTGGIIRKIFVDEGDKVSKDQVLAELELEEIKSRLEQAELGMSKARRDFKRIENLYNDSVATLENYQDAKTALELAETDLRIAKFNLKHSVIRAPENGNILKRFSDEHELIGPGNPVFLFGSTASNWIVDVALSDQDAVLVEKGDSARVFIDAWPAEAFRAWVHQVSSAADPYTGTFNVQLKLSATEKNLLSGLIARVEIYSGENEEYVLVPVEALNEANKHNASVFVVNDSKVSKKRIKTGRITGDYCIVKQGLEVGDEVVTEGNKYIDSESVIRVIN